MNCMSNSLLYAQLTFPVLQICQKSDCIKLASNSNIFSKKEEKELVSNDYYTDKLGFTAWFAAMKDAEKEAEL
jgi:hypothetical protein